MGELGKRVRVLEIRVYNEMVKGNQCCLFLSSACSV